MTEPAINLNNLDKSSWNTYRFDEIAQNISERVDPNNTDLEVYVGLEHIDSESLHIKRAGSPNDVNGQKLKFYKGDIIFGRRRAYQRKAGIADCDGFCSAHSLVLRANSDVIDPMLFPFFLHSDLFMNRAIDISVGSLSPTINWGTLKHQEFRLPGKDQQTALAEVLWSLEELIKKELQVEENLALLPQSIFKHELFEETEEFDTYFQNCSSKYEVKLLGDLITTLQYGISESLSEEQSSGIPVLRMNNLQGGKLDLSDLKYFNAKNEELDNFILNKGDVLFNRTNSFDLVGKVSLFDDDETYSFASYLIRIVVDKELLDPRFLNYYLNSEIGLAKIRKYRTPGVSQSNINAQNLKRIPIPLPPIGIQNELMDRIEQLQDTEELLMVKTGSSKSLQKTLINQAF